MNYELLFVKKNIKIADKKHSKFFVKKIISENLLYKINKYNNLHNNNQFKVNNAFKKNFELFKTTSASLFNIYFNIFILKRFNN